MNTPRNRLPFAVRLKYPHMFPKDIPVWERFVLSMPNFYREVAYDVVVGQGIAPDPNLPPNIRADATILTQKRIDAVGFVRHEIHVIEIKPVASVSAPGQALAYAKLYESTYRPTASVVPVLICSHAPRDVLTVADQFGVEVFQV